MNSENKEATEAKVTTGSEKPVSFKMGGVTALVIHLIVLIFIALNVYQNLYSSTGGDFYHESKELNVIGIVVRSLVGIVALIFSASGFITVYKNDAYIFTFMGEYKGTLREEGFHWLPFWWSRSNKISLALRTITIGPITVSDKGGKPIVIGCDIFAHQADTYKAYFNIDDLDAYLESKGEIALRDLAKKYHMDSGQNTETTLRDSADTISNELEVLIVKEYKRAGQELEKAGITELKYAPEVAASMLQRQNAESVIDARKVIAEGAAGIVKDTIAKLEADAGVKLDDGQKAKLATGLLITLCSHTPATPTVSVGE